MPVVVTLAVGITSLVCWIMNIVIAFRKEDGILLGVLSICGIIGFIIGWIKVKQWGHQTLMIVWTLAILIGLLLRTVGPSSVT